MIKTPDSQVIKNIGKNDQQFLRWCADVTTSLNKVRVPVTTLLSTPIDGMLEYDGAHLYFTIGTTRSLII